ncbi:hypothetical protein GIY62_35275 (plasmid) [Burkholderia plantarii]|uniref:hypothetical protein n=1 Tax=Burkholderia plantarii TaxID=41899 RepID=UPI00272B213C|nr:hypothetical protein [Burkholderia plantarii]WLE64126.1 hypothetical protein GIY62_35275 [Burkholderia plantarii]
MSTPPKRFFEDSSRWLGPLLTSLPIYLSRMLFVVILEPLATLSLLVALFSPAPFIESSQAAWQIAIGSAAATTPAVLRICEGASPRIGHCERSHTIEVPLSALAVRSAAVLRETYFFLVLVGFLVGLKLWRPTPFGLYWRGRLRESRGDQ